MRKLKNKFVLSIFCITIMLLIVSFLGIQNVSAIEDDEYEPNDYFTSASELYPNYYFNLVNLNDDYYMIYLNLEHNVSIDVFNSSVLDVKWFNSSYDLLTDFSVEDSHLILDWEPTYEGIYYIRVNGTNLGDFYDIDIWLSDDWAEPNDDLGDPCYIGTGNHGGLIQYDEDWFGYGPVNYMQTLEVYLYYNTAFVLDIELVDEYGIPHGYSLISETWGKKLEWTAGGDYSNVYIHVNGSDIGLNYNFDLSILGDSGDDWAEENDDWNSAHYLDSGDYYQLFNYDDDYYRFHLNKGDSGKIYIYCENNAPIWLEEISSYDGSTFNTDYSTDDGFLQLHFFNVDYDQDIIFAVKGGNYGDWYDILIGQAGEDWAEDNDDLNNAWHLDLGYHDGLTQIDDDWYEVWLEPNDLLEINLIYDTGITSLNLDLYDENEILLTSSYDTSYLTWNNDDTGNHVYIRVFGPGNGDSYALDLKIDYKDDSDKDNNGDDPFANFDLSSIPGFPIEIVGSTFIFSTIAVILYVKKKEH